MRFQTACTTHKLWPGRASSTSTHVSHAGGIDDVAHAAATAQEGGGGGRAAQRSVVAPCSAVHISVAERSIGNRGRQGWRGKPPQGWGEPRVEPGRSHCSHVSLHCLVFWYEGGARLAAYALHLPAAVLARPAATAVVDEGGAAAAAAGAQAAAAAAILVEAQGCCHRNSLLRVLLEGPQSIALGG